MKQRLVPYPPFVLVQSVAVAFVPHICFILVLLVLARWWRSRRQGKGLLTPEKIVKAGFFSCAILYGMLGWGVPFWVAMSILVAVTLQRMDLILVTLPLALGGGIIFGTCMWIITVVNHVPNRTPNFCGRCGLSLAGVTSDRCPRCVASTVRGH